MQLNKQQIVHSFCAKNITSYLSLSTTTEYESFTNATYIQTHFSFCQVHLQLCPVTHRSISPTSSSTPWSASSIGSNGTDVGSGTGVVGVSGVSANGCGRLAVIFLNTNCLVLIIFISLQHKFKKFDWSIDLYHFAITISI